MPLQRRRHIGNLLEAIKQYLTSPDCVDLKFVLHDFADADHFEYSETEFAALASFAMQNYQGADQVPRCAITNSDSIRQSIDLYSELTGRPWEFVQSRGEAEVWKLLHL